MKRSQRVSRLPSERAYHRWKNCRSTQQRYDLLMDELRENQQIVEGSAHVREFHGRRNVGITVQPNAPANHIDLNLKVVPPEQVYVKGVFINGEPDGAELHVEGDAETNSPPERGFSQSYCTCDLETCPKVCRGDCGCLACHSRYVFLDINGDPDCGCSYYQCTKPDGCRGECGCQVCLDNAIGVGECTR